MYDIDDRIGQDRIDKSTFDDIASILCSVLRPALSVCMFTRPTFQTSETLSAAQASCP